MANNPALVAWNEAVQMANPVSTTPPRVPKLLISVGTGMPRGHSRFGLVSLFRSAVRNITDTNTANQAMVGISNTNPNSTYVRLDVPENPTTHRGLADLELDQCKKKKSSNPNLNAPILGNPATIVQRFKQRDEKLRQNAMQNMKGGYKPGKYRYMTFDEIRDHTATYCGTHSVQMDIQKCARILRDESVQRKNNDQAQWQRFRTHPNPDHT